MRVKVTPRNSINYNCYGESPYPHWQWREILVGSMNKEKSGGSSSSSSLGNGNIKEDWENMAIGKYPPLEFCSETAMHGLKYIVQPKRHFIERVFWSLSFLVGLGLSVWLINDVYKKYNETPIIVSFWPTETFVREIPFPAVTVCNMNKIMKSKALQYIRKASANSEESKTLSSEAMDALRNVYYLDHVCSSTKSFLQSFNTTSNNNRVINPELVNKIKNLQIQSDEGQIHQFFRNSSQTCKSMIPLCVWRDNVRNCTPLFRHVETDFGKCCTFNMVPQLLLTTFPNQNVSDKAKKYAAEWNLTKAYLDVEDLIPKDEVEKERVSSFSLPRRAVGAGKNYGLSFLLRPNLKEYFCSGSDSLGFQLTTHLTTSMPHLVDFGTAIQPNSEVFIKVTPDVTLADDDIQSFSLEKRNCYLKGEFQLKFYRYYTRENCLDECMTNITFLNCNCVRYFMTNDGTRELCGPKKFECAENVRRKILNSRDEKYCFQCKPTCTEITYRTGTTFTHLFPSSEFWNDGWSLEDKEKNQNSSIVHIYFGEQSFYPKIRKELFGLTDLTANVGGVLGLCLGFSALSAVELIYFLTIRPWYQPERKG